MTQFADVKIREAHRRITALDLSMNELSASLAGQPAEFTTPGVLTEIRERHFRLREERKKALLELLEQLELVVTPRDEMGSA